MREQLDGWFELTSRRTCEFTMCLHPEEVEAVVGMGPSSRHARAGALREAVAALPDPLPVSASVSVSVYRRG